MQHRFRRLAWLVPTTLLALSLPIWPRQAARAAAPLAVSRLYYTTGMFSLVRGETMRASFVNGGADRGFGIRWLVQDVQGNALAMSPLRSVPAGKADFFDLDFDSLPFIGNRREIRVSVYPTGKVAAQYGRGFSLAVETFEGSTGGTRTRVEGVDPAG
jgi:hypothetical protein